MEVLEHKSPLEAIKRITNGVMYFNSWYMPKNDGYIFCIELSGYGENDKIHRYSEIIHRGTFFGFEAGWLSKKLQAVEFAVEGLAVNFCMKVTKGSINMTPSTDWDYFSQQIIPLQELREAV